jgi:hypothetical protein
MPVLRTNSGGALSVFGPEIRRINASHSFERHRLQNREAQRLDTPCRAAAGSLHLRFSLWPLRARCTTVQWAIQKDSTVFKYRKQYLARRSLTAEVRQRKLTYNVKVHMLRTAWTRSSLIPPLDPVPEYRTSRACGRRTRCTCGRLQLEAPATCTMDERTWQRRCHLALSSRTPAILRLRVWCPCSQEGRDQISASSRHLRVCQEVEALFSLMRGLSLCFGYAWRGNWTNDAGRAFAYLEPRCLNCQNATYDTGSTSYTC